MKQRKQQAAEQLATLEGDNIPRPVRKKKGGLRLKAKHHRRLKKVLAASSACAILVGGTFGINALFFTEAAPNVVEEGFETVLYEVPADGSTPDMHSALENIGYMNARFRAQETWYSEMEGSVDTMLSQSVRTWKQYADGVLIQTDITTSSLINSAKQFCWVGDRVLWREAAGNASTYNGIDTVWKEGDPYGNMSVEDYKKTRGLPGTEFSVYVINEETLLDASAVTDNGDGTYTQTYYLDPATDKAPAYYVTQMMVTGGLSKLPVFESITVTYTFDATWQVLSSYIDEAYTATKGLDAKCTANYLTTYEYGTDRAYSDAYESYYKNYADKPATGAPEEGALTAADCLAEAFAPVLTQPVTFSLGLTLDSLPVQGLVSVDATDMSALTLRAKLGEAYLAYEGGNIYVQFGENKIRLDGAALSGLLGEGAPALDTDALLEQLGGGTFEQAGDGRSATLDSNLSLMGLEIPVRFTFDIAQDGTISLGGVSAELYLADMKIAAALSYAEGSVPAVDMSDSTDITPLVMNLAELFTGDALSAQLSYAMEVDGRPLSLEGEVQLDFATLGVKGGLNITLGKGESALNKQLTFAYSAAGEGDAKTHWVYLALDGMQLKLNAADAVTFLTGLFGAEEGADNNLALGELLTKLLSLDLGTMVRLTEGSVVLAGGELLAALGVDFALGDVTLSALPDGIGVSALGISAQLAPAQSFTVNEQDYAAYADVTPVLGTVRKILQQQAIALGGEFSLRYGGTAFSLAVENGVLSWKNGFALSLDLAITVDGTRQTIGVEADGTRLRLLYGSVGVELVYDDLYLLSEAFSQVYARVVGILNRSVSGEGLPATVEALSAQLGAGGAVTELLASLDLPALLSGIVLGGATQAEGSIATISYQGISLDVLLREGGLALSLAKTALGDVTLSGALSLSAQLPAGGGQQPAQVQPMTASDLAELLDFVGAAVATLASSDVTVGFAGETLDAQGQKVFDISGTLAWHSGTQNGTFPVFVDLENKTITLEPQAYLYVSLTLDEIAADGTDLFFEFWMLDAHGDGELDFFVSISKYAEGTTDADGNEIYKPLRFAVSASDILTILSSGVSLAQDTLTQFLTGMGISAEAADTVLSVLDSFLVSQWLNGTDKAQLSALGNVLMGTLGIRTALEDFLGGVADAVGDAAEDVATIDPGKYLSSLGITRGEDGSVTFGIVLNSDLIYGGTELAPLRISLSKQGEAGSSLLSGISLGGIWGNGNAECTGVEFGVAYSPLTLTQTADGASLAVQSADGVQNVLAQLSYADYASYTFAGVDELIKSVAASATHQQADGTYTLNDSFVLSGNATLSIGDWDAIQIGVDGVSVRVDENGDSCLNLKISYKREGVGILVFRSSGTTELTIKEGFAYLRRIAGGTTEYRVMPASNFLAGILQHLSFMFNFTSLVEAFIPDEPTSTTPTVTTDDYGIVLGNILSQYSYRAGAEGGNWKLTLNGGALTGVLGDISIELGSEHYNGTNNVLRTLDIITSIIGVVNITANLTFRNPCNVWEEGCSDVTSDLAQLFDGAADGIAAIDWAAQAEDYYIEPQQSQIRYTVDGEEVEQQSVWHVGDTLLSVPELPDVTQYKKKGHTLAWQNFTFTAGGDNVYQAFNTPENYDVTLIAPVTPSNGDDWTDNGDGTYSFAIRLQYGAKISVTYYGITTVYTMGEDGVLRDDDGNALDLTSFDATFMTASLTMQGGSISLFENAVEVVYSGVLLETQTVYYEADLEYELLGGEVDGQVFLGWWQQTGGRWQLFTSTAFTADTQLEGLWYSATSGSMEGQRWYEWLKAKDSHSNTVTMNGVFTASFAGEIVLNATDYRFAVDDNAETVPAGNAEGGTGNSCTITASTKDYAHARVTQVYSLNGYTITIVSVGHGKYTYHFSSAKTLMSANLTVDSFTIK